MCILCKYKKNNPPLVDLGAIQQTSIDRKGLSNIYNISNDLSFINDVFSSPLLNVSGATIPVSGITTTNCSGPFTGSSYSVSGCTFVYNLSETDDIDLIFNITGNTQYTAYTGSLCYHTFDLNKIPRDRNFVVKGDSVLSDCFVYTAITANTIYETISLGELPIKDAQYILKDYNVYETKDFSENLLINTFDLTTESLDDLFDTGWYFVTVVNPEKPTILESTAFNISNTSVLSTEIPLLIEGQTTIFTIKGVALNNKFIVYLNGIQLTEGLDWVSIPNSNGMFELVSGTLEPDKDVIMVTYLSGNLNPQDIFNYNEPYLNLDAGIVNNITTGVTSGVTALTVNYNPIKNRQEILLTKSVLINSSLIFVVNGVRLAENVDYFKSSTDREKIIMDPNSIIKKNDAVSVFYFSNESDVIIQLGTYRTLEPQISWSVPESYNGYLSENGQFLVEVTTANDKTFSNPIQAKYVDFNRIDNQYSITLDTLPTNLGENFLVRVYFFKDYPILYNNIVTTRSISDAAAFTVNIKYTQNTY